MARRYNDKDLFKKLKNQKSIIKQLEEKEKVSSTAESSGYFARRQKSRKPLSDESVPEKPETEADQTAEPLNEQPKQAEERPETKPPELKRVEKTAQPIRQVPPREIRPIPQEETEQKRPSAQVEPEPTLFEPPAVQEPAAKAQERQPKQEPVSPDAYTVPKRPKEPDEKANEIPEAALKTKAERIYRHELKFYINCKDYYMIRNALRGLLHHDENAFYNGTYHIRSLYFDDGQNSALKDKISGVRERKKYRIRIYNYSDSFIRLEKKVKKDEYISKDNLVLTRGEYQSIIEGNIMFLAKKKSQLAQDMYREMKLNQLRPVSVVEYNREAFVHPLRHVRLTFDTDLKTGLWGNDIFDENLPVMSMLDKGIMVMEVKFYKYLPDYIKGVLNNAMAASRSAVSKYAICRKFD